MGGVFLPNFWNVPASFEMPSMWKTEPHTLFRGILGAVLLRMKASPTRIADPATIPTKIDSMVISLTVDCAAFGV